MVNAKNPIRKTASLVIVHSCAEATVGEGRARVSLLERCSHFPRAADLDTDPGLVKKYRSDG
jgi:hypothetical protein